MQGLVVKQEVDVYHASELSSLGGEKKKFQSIKQSINLRRLPRGKCGFSPRQRTVSGRVTKRSRVLVGGRVWDKEDGGEWGRAGGEVTSQPYLCCSLY